ncbi:GNAT family N-acetyltransferase [Cesiribacter sp. SM1]|uniref:GNAT family N-acetyltransferase n=1 Tax=Cesiribacter sp. SM1 TaxID=2861196 RepID=UPI001CD454FB
MKNPIKIREESPADHAAVYSLLASAFGREDEAKLVERLRASTAYIPELCLVAEHAKNGIVGYIQFTHVHIAGKQSYPSLALAPMAVTPGYQNTGIGSLLVQAGLTRAREIGYQSVIVLGHQEYYPRFGFRPASAWGIFCPFEVPDEAFMAIELEKGALNAKAGTVVYSPAFNLP